MAKKTHTGPNDFKKYRDNRKKTEAFLNKVQRKSISNYKKATRKKEAARKKRMNAYRREAEKERAARAKAEAKRVSEPVTEEEAQAGGCALLIIFGLILLAILFFVIGPKGLLIIFGIAIAIFIIYFIHVIKMPRDLTQEEIEELQRHLTNIDVYKNIANTSTDPYAVQCAMDELISSIDFIMSYEEDELHQAGMSKAKLPEQRAFIVQHYDDMIAQANE